MDEQQINGSGLFFFRSSLPTNRKIEILNWYNTLSQEQKDFVMDLRIEAMNESEFFSNEQ